MFGERLEPELQTEFSYIVKKVWVGMSGGVCVDANNHM